MISLSFPVYEGLEKMVELVEEEAGRGSPVGGKTC